MVHVEFVGIPGAGKSVVRDALVVKLQHGRGRGKYLTRDEAFCKVSMMRIDNCYRWWLKLLPWEISLYFSNKLRNRSVMQIDAQNSFLAKYGRSLSTYLASDEFVQMVVNDRKNSIAFFLATGSIFEVINKNLTNDNVVFFSEGFVQKSFMFLQPGKKKNSNQNLVETYLSNIPQSDLLFYIKTDPVTCLNRMKARSKGFPKRLKQVSEEEILDFLERADAHLTTVTRYLKQCYNVKTVEIENLSTIEDVVSSAMICFADA